MYRNLLKRVGGDSNILRFLKMSIELFGVTEPAMAANHKNLNSFLPQVATS